MKLSPYDDRALLSLNPSTPTLACAMKIILAAPRGFCAGVNMAIQSLDLTLQEFGPPVYVYHEIVHNQYVVNEFKDKGAVFVDQVSEIPEALRYFFQLMAFHQKSEKLLRKKSARLRRHLSARHQSPSGSN